MTIEKIIGTWQLIGSVSINSEIDYSNLESDQNPVSSWLNDSGTTLINNVIATTGLTLVISADLSFQESREGNPAVEWFNSEGVLEAEVLPFNGYVTHNKHGYFLLPEEVQSWAELPKEYRVILRYDDGDTKICDRIFPHEGKLIRTVNVVTDDMYLNRIIVAYTKV